MYPERPVANTCFKVYGYISMSQALKFLEDFKLGHYMKIPPRYMFMAQVVGTMVAVVVYLGTAWCLMESILFLHKFHAFSFSQFESSGGSRREQCLKQNSNLKVKSLGYKGNCFHRSFHPTKQVVEIQTQI